MRKTTSAAEMGALGSLLLLLAGCWLAPGARDGPRTGGGSGRDELVERAADVAAIGGLDLELSEGGEVVSARLVSLHATDVPNSARRTIEERYASSRLLGWSEVLEADGSGYFEVLLDTGGTRCRVAVEDNGQELQRRCEISPDAIPAAVASANDEVEGPIVRAERVEALHETYFIIERRGQNRLHHLEVMPSGEILGHEVLLTAQVMVPYLGAPLRQVTFERPPEVAPAPAPASPQPLGGSPSPFDGVTSAAGTGPDAGAPPAPGAGPDAGAGPEAGEPRDDGPLTEEGEASPPADETPQPAP